MKFTPPSETSTSNSIGYANTILDGTFKLGFSRFVVRNMSQTSVSTGTGYVRLDGEIFLLDMLSPSSSGIDVKLSWEANNLAPGERIPQNVRCVAEGSGANGTSWWASDFKLNVPMPPGNDRAHAKIDEWRNSEYAESGPVEICQLIFPRPLLLPADADNGHIWLCEDGVELHIKNYSNKMLVAVQLDTPSPTSVETALQLATTFVFSEYMRWIVASEKVVRARRSEFIHRVRPAARSISTIHLNPVPWNGHGASQNALRLIIKLFNALRKNDSTSDLLGLWIWQIHVMGAGPYLNMALDSCIAVEALVNELSTKPVPKKVLSEIEAVEKRILKWKSISPNIKSRLKGLIGNMKRPSPKERMLQLVEVDVLRPAHAQAWGRIRNAAAHGQKVSSNQNGLDSQVQDAFSVRGAFYCLIAHAVGFSGRMSDLTSIGWPAHDFPWPVPKHDVSSD